MTTIWVNQRDGDDSFNGLTASTPKKTIEAGIAAVPAGQTVNIVHGTYTDPVITTAKSCTLYGIGQVIMKSATDGVFLDFGSSSTVSVDWRLRNINFVNYKNVVSFAHTADTDSSVNIYLDNCVYFRSVATAGNSVINMTNTSTVGVARASVFMQNNTADHSSGSPVVWTVTGTVDMDIVWERNNVYTNSEPALSTVSGSGGSITRLNHDYNGYISNSEPNGASTIPSFYNTSTEPYDLGIDRSSSSSFIGQGEYGNDIGATWWPITAFNPATLSVTESSNRSKNDPANNTEYFPSDWGVIGDGWANDDSYCDSITGLVGTSAPADASPSIFLSTSLDPRWVINFSLGGGGSARVRGPVWDFGRPVKARGVTWFAEEDESKPGGERLVIDSDTTNFSGRSVEYRASNSVFLADDSSPAWTVVKKDSDYDASPLSTTGRNRYWQFRVVLRTNGSL